ncbi:hypothetical protein BKA66DRAFT_515313 [Pyrenochaeta sp. MPI-SDFR-AT-0127]|nr:hypothetical protein BKA66DRAFT_515313 [Pyrenochaeta sp. MPI-SDFR-AT-0127]
MEPDLNATSQLLNTFYPLVAVIGVGYVGAHLVNIFSPFVDVIGYDISSTRIRKLSSENSGANRMRFSTDSENLEGALHFLIAVSTNSRLDGIGSIVVIESTVAIGTTRRLLEPLAISRGILPACLQSRTSPPVCSISKIVSGLDNVVPGSLHAITELYELAFDTIITVSSPEVAEMMKMYENCQRTMAIAYANEMADACARFGIDPFKVAETAATKPFRYLPIFSSHGIGGYCISANPIYFMSTCTLPLLQYAHEKMSVRPSRIGSKLLTTLLDDNSRIHGPNHEPRLLIVGLGFKAGQSDLAHSPGIQLLNYMRLSTQVDLIFCDPLVEQATIPEVSKLSESHWTPEILETFNAIVVVTKQPGLDYSIWRGYKVSE